MKMKKIKHTNIGLYILCVVFLSFLLWLSARNLPLVLPYGRQLAAQEITFPEFRDAVAKAYREDLGEKEFFLNLNGLFVRSLNQNASNERLVAPHKMLLRQHAPLRDMSARGSNLVALNTWLQQSEIPFLYVNIPGKVDLKGEMAVTGADDFNNQNCDNLLKILRDNQVDYVDLRQYQSADGRQVMKNFYRTDHHWTPAAALEAGEIILKHLQETYPEENYSTSVLDLKNWDVRSKPDWFLGSSGKRVGSTLVGVDDLIWAVPKFETKMAFMAPFDSVLTRGSFEDALIHEEFLEEKDYFNLNPYYVYHGTEYGLVQHRNPQAPIDKKILIVKDSFMVPLQSFFSTVFREVEVLDLRYLKGTTLTEYIRGYDPDLVMIAHTIEIKEGGFGPMDFPARVQTEVREDSEEKMNFIIPRLQNGIVTVKSRHHGYSNERFLEDLTPDTDYMVTVQEMHFTEGYSDQVSISLWDSGTDEILDTVEFDLKRDNASGTFSWTFHTPEQFGGPAYLLLYSGLWGSADHKAVTATGVSVTEYHKDVQNTPAVPIQLMENRTIYIPFSEHRNNNASLAEDLELGKKYTVQIDSVEFTLGGSEGLSLLVYDTETDEALRATVCDVEFCNQNQGGFQWSFCAPREAKGSLRLIVYAGLRRQTEGNAVKLNGVDVTLLQ